MYNKNKETEGVPFWLFFKETGRKKKKRDKGVMPRENKSYLCAAIHTDR